jgi:pimeloyl-ACP methyl ester carboxylesterase
MAFIERNDARIYHEIYGNEGAPPMLLSNAFACTTAMWKKQVEPFSRNFRLILWDMRGHGKTQVDEKKENFSHQHTLEDMVALLQHYNISSAIIGGLSLGGYLSLMFYNHFPQMVKGLLLCDTGPGFKKDEARNKWNHVSNRTADALEKRGLGATPKVPNGVKHTSATALALAARNILTQDNAFVINRLDQVEVPALIIVGADDKPFHPSADYMEKKIPNVEKIIIPNAEHYANDDNPEAFNASVLEFFNIA